MAKRSKSTDAESDHRGAEPMTKETRKALAQAAKSERRLVEREQAALDKVERTRQGLSEAVERLAKAQERVSRRADRLAEAEAELRLRQRERLNGPHHSAVASPYEAGRKRGGSGSTSDEAATPAPGQEAAADLGLLTFPGRPESGESGAGEPAPSGESTEQPGQGVAHDLGLSGADAPVRQGAAQDPGLTSDEPDAHR